jgi:RimJ/RimL family protein N-acetyltransferase
MTLQPLTLIGEQVQLLPLSKDHVGPLFEAGNDPQIWAHMPARISNREEMRTWVAQALAAQAQGTELPFAIYDRSTERIVGSTRLLDYDAANRGIEIGNTWHTPAVWRTRINTECKYLLLGHCFETLCVIRVQLKTDARNLRSQRAIERIGGVREGVLRHHRIMPDGYLRDSVYFSILDEEWPAIKSRLEAFLIREPLG